MPENRRRGVVPAVVLLLLSFPSTSASAPLEPDQAVRVALDLHPAVVEAEANLTEARGDLRAATLFRENPDLAARLGTDGARRELEVSQPLSLTGEGLAARRSAAAMVEATEASLRRARVEAAAEVRHAWVACAVAVQAALLAREAFDLASRLVDVTEARYQAGDAPELDARLARLGRAQAAERYLVARREEAAALARLGTLIGRTVTADEMATDPREAAPAASPAAHERSDVVAARLQADAARSALSAERAAMLPPVSVGWFVDQDGPAQMMGPTVGIQLPLWQQNAGGRGRARGDLLRAEAEADRAAVRALAEQEATAGVASEAAGIVTALGTDLRADADAAFLAIETGYQAGEIDLPTVLFLRDEVVSARGALFSTYGASTDAAIDHLLATEDASLLGVQP